MTPIARSERQWFLSAELVTFELFLNREADILLTSFSLSFLFELRDNVSREWPISSTRLSTGGRYSVKCVGISIPVAQPRKPLSIWSPFRRCVLSLRLSIRLIIEFGRRGEVGLIWIEYSLRIWWRSLDCIVCPLYCGVLEYRFWRGADPGRHGRRLEKSPTVGSLAEIDRT